MAKIIFYIGLGGFMGSVLRYYIASYVQVKSMSNWPFGTFLVNLVGCFLIGLIFAVAERTIVSAEWRLFLVTGLCGGLTTFSSFSLEILSLLRAGYLTHAFTYVAVSLIVGLAGVWGGMALGKVLV